MYLKRMSMLCKANDEFPQVYACNSQDTTCSNTLRVLRIEPNALANALFQLALPRAPSECNGN